TDHDQVVLFLRFLRRAQRFPLLAVAQLVRVGVHTFLIAPQTGKRGWIVGDCPTGDVLAQSAQSMRARHSGGECRAANRDRHAIQKIAPRNLPAESKLLVACRLVRPAGHFRICLNETPRPANRSLAALRFARSARWDLGTDSLPRRPNRPVSPCPRRLSAARRSRGS